MQTREGNIIYPINSPIRQAVVKASLCKDCVHLGDLCVNAGREFYTSQPSAADAVIRSYVVTCHSWQQVDEDCFN